MAVANILEWTKIFLNSMEGVPVQDIKLATSSNDLETIVTLVTKVVETLESNLVTPRILVERKSAEISNNFRRMGNLHFISNEHKKAIQCFNRALAHAPNNSIEVKLAYSNISALMYSIGAYRDCQWNIKAAQEMDCPEFLRVKLEKRMMDSKKLMLAELIRDMRISDAYMENYIKFEVERNEEIPCMSTDVCVDGGQNVVAARDIKSGTMVAFERAFVSIQDDFDEYTSCYYCQKMCFFFIPCDGCCRALFCSQECMEKCMEDYHRIECQIVVYMNGHSDQKDIHKLAIRAAIKMSLKLNWKELRVASLEMGEKLLKKSSVGEAFDHNNPMSMLCYNDGVTVSSSTMIDASIITAAAVFCLSLIPEYLPKAEKKRRKAIATLTRIILHLSTTFLRKITIWSSALDYFNDTYRWNAQRSIGWFSLASKLAHSCEPNMLAVGFNDHVALIALQRVKKGDPLTISYVEHFYDVKELKHFNGTTVITSPQINKVRQKKIFNDIQYKCECRVCLLEWHGIPTKEGALTNRQKEAYLKCRTAMTNGSFEEKMTAIGTALDELSQCINTKQHFELYADLKQTLSTFQCAKDSNKSFQCVMKYVFMVEK